MTNLAIQIERWPVDRLIPSDANPRTHSPEQVAQIAASIREFGFVNPILVGADGGIIAGEGRFRAALTLGHARSSGDCARSTCLKSNVARWPSPITSSRSMQAGTSRCSANNWQPCRTQDFDLDLLGFDDEELARQLADA